MGNLAKRFVDISENWKLRKGKNELLAHMNGERLTRADVIIAKCYECESGYDDDKPADCNVPACPLYQYMPYREGRNKREVSEEAREKARDRLARAREGKK